MCGPGDHPPYVIPVVPDPPLRRDPCQMCGAPPGERHKPLTPTPDLEELEEWLYDGGCEATDGCWVEPDGRCEHGHTSWLRVLGMV